jgi:hypothetical protein
MTTDSKMPARRAQLAGDQTMGTQRQFALVLCAELVARLVVRTRGFLGRKSAGANRVTSLMALAAAFLLPLAAQAQGNFVYVNDQTTANSVSGFVVTAAGALTVVPGSPFLTGGSGASSSCPALDRIVVSAPNKLLFVSNSLDLTISAFSIDPITGGLTAVPGSPFASGLTVDSCQGMSLAVTPDGRFLMASSNGQIKSFAIAANGSLSLSATTTNASSPTSSMKISANSQFLALSNLNTVSLFSINSLDGSLTAVANSPFSATGTGQNAGLEFSCRADRLYGAETDPTTAITDAWSIAPTGALSPILGSPFLSAGANSSSVLFTPDNTTLYQTSPSANAVTPLHVNLDGSLTALATVGGPGQTTSPAGMATDPNGNNLYVADDGFGLAVYTIGDDGTLTFLANTPISAGGAGQIQGIAAYPPRSCTVTDLSVSISAPTTVNVTAGAQSISYVITVANKGLAASSFTLTDNLTLGLFTKASCTAGPGATCDKGAGLKRQITFTLAAGQSGSVTVGATTGTSSVFFNGDILSNTAFISHASTADSNPADNSATSNITVTAPIVAGKLTAAAATGPYFGTTTLQATLTRAAPVVAAVGKTITFSVNGTVMGTAVTDANGVASLPISLAGLNAGTYTGGISASFAADTQLLTTTASSTLTITKVPLTLTPTDVAKLYGDPNPTFPYTLSGFVNNETPAVVSGTAACTANASATTAVGTSVINCTTGTMAATNYSFVFVKGTLTINPAPLVMAGTDASRLYGDVNPPIGGTLVGLKNADQASATFAVNAVQTSPVGVYPIIGTLVPGKSFTATNYTVSSSGNLTITPAPLTATATSVSRVYGDPNPAFTGTITGLKNGDAVTATFTSTATAGSPVGTYPITATLTGAAATNYTVIPGAGTLTITPAPLSVSAGDATRLYGDANPVLAGTITGLKNGDAITATYASVDATSPIGAYAITPTLVDPAGKLGNYTVTSSNGTLTVTPAPLSVVTANLSRVYGDPNPVFTATITGLKNGDNITASFSTTATTASPVGTYPILATLSDPTAKLGNYSVTNTSGALSVTPATLTVTINDATRLFGDPNPAFSGTIIGLKNGDVITTTYSTTATTTSPVGTYPITATLLDPNAKLSNYTVISNDGTLTIVSKPAAVLVAPATGSGRRQLFQFAYSDPAGFAAITSTRALIGASAGLAQTCGLNYTAATKTMAISDDNGSGWGAPAPIGLPGSLENSQCSIDLGASSAAGSGDTLLLNLAITFKPSYLGTKSLIAWVDNKFGNNSGFQTLGSWTIAPPLPTSIGFGQQRVGKTSVAQVLTLTNPASVPLPVGAISIGGTNPTNFAQTNDCGTGLAPGGSCSITVTVTPKAAVALSATLSVPGVQNVSLTASGIQPQAVLSATSLAFGQQLVATTSAAQTVTLSNPGNTVLAISGISVLVNPISFAQTNDCGTSLAPGASCTISVTMTPKSAVPLSARVSIADDLGTQSIVLSGSGIAPRAVLSPASLTFAPQNVGTTSPVQTITLSNPGNAALPIIRIAIGGTNVTNFAQANDCGLSLAAGTNCSISVTMTPKAAVALFANVTIVDSIGTQAVTLTGSGTAARASVSTTSLTFAPQVVGSTSTAQAVTLSNSGTGPLAISSIGITNGNVTNFAEVNNCGTSLAAGASCSINVTMTPKAAVSLAAHLTIVDAVGTQTVLLSGSGIAPKAVFSATSLVFASQLVGTTSPVQTMTLSNSGTGALQISGISIGGANPTNFAEVNDCGTSLIAGGSCTINVTMTPKAAVALSAQLTLADAIGTQTVGVTGSGAAPEAVLSPASLSFAPQPVGTTSAPQTVTLSNPGNAPLAISSISIANGNVTNFAQVNDCGARLAAGASCAITVTMTPKAGIGLSAHVTVVDSIGAQSALLSGSGQ